ncbi:MAG: hypothetical protein ACTSP1_19755, partial [Candidatus Freyarchaeota archaeon]
MAACRLPNVGRCCGARSWLYTTRSGRSHQKCCASRKHLDFANGTAAFRRARNTMNVPAISETKINQIPTPESDVVAIDVELLGMRRGKLHRPTGKFGSLAISDGRTAWLILDQGLIQRALDAVRDCTWVFHNAQFDIFHLRRWAVVAERPPGRFWDTMIWERILWSGYFDSMGLEDLARRYLDISLSKEPRKLFETYSYMTPKMLDYAAMDAFM